MTFNPQLPGLAIVLHFAPTYLMKAEDAYLSAIAFMYQIAFAGWEGTIAPGFEGFSKEVNLIKVGFKSFAEAGDAYQLQNKHLAIGLLLMLNKSASKKRFCFTKADIYMYNICIGSMAIGRRAPEELAMTNNSTNVTLDKLKTTGDSTDNWQRDLGVGGEIVDPEDSDFVITYEMLTNPIPCQSLLNAALNAMTNAALWHNNDPCREFGGFSSLRDVTWQILTPTPGTTRAKLNYLLVRTLLNLLPARLYERNLCREVDYQFHYAGEKIGWGDFLVSDYSDRDRKIVGQ